MLNLKKFEEEHHFHCFYYLSAQAGKQPSKIFLVYGDLPGINSTTSRDCTLKTNSITFSRVKFVQHLRGVAIRFDIKRKTSSYEIF